MNYLFGDEAISLPDLAARGIQVRALEGGDLELTEGERIVRVPVGRDDKGAVHVFWEGRSYVFTPASARRNVAARKSGSLTAPMTGVVVDVLVAVGDSVEAYQSVAVIEAMKVLATLEAPLAGVVKAVHYARGDRVEHGAVVVEIE
jgi:biotin carboxyl carrier protein